MGKAISYGLIMVILAAFAFGIGLLIAGPGAGFGWWEYGEAFQVYRKAVTPAMVAALLGVLAAFVAFRTGRGALGVLAVAASLTAGAGAYVPLKIKRLADAHPFIHDITTDFENPPMIVAAADAPRSNPAAYVGAELVIDGQPETTAEAQRRGFPDLAPVVLESDLNASIAKAKLALDEMGMEIIAEGAVSEEANAAWRIEATYTSAWFRFVDDFVVRLTPLEDGKTKVDIRSKSRVGKSDLGANAARIRDFSARLQA